MKGESYCACEYNSLANFATPLIPLKNTELLNSLPFFQILPKLYPDCCGRRKKKKRHSKILNNAICVIALSRLTLDRQKKWNEMKWCQANWNRRMPSANEIRKFLHRIYCSQAIRCWNHWIRNVFFKYLTAREMTATHVVSTWMR